MCVFVADVWGGVSHAGSLGGAEIGELQLGTERSAPAQVSHGLSR